MYGFFLLLVLDILFLIFAKQFIVVSKAVLYSTSLLILLFCVWRLAMLKTFSLEVSEHILSVKYEHPLSHIHHPVLEVPLQKVLFFKVEKGIVNYFMVININTKRGMRSFYYRIGNLPEKNTEKLENISNFIKRSRMKFEDQL